jgi:hypothetical protein
MGGVRGLWTIRMEPDIADRDIPRSGYGAQLTWLFCPDSQAIVLHLVPAGIRVSVKMGALLRSRVAGDPEQKAVPDEKAALAAPDRGRSIGPPMNPNSEICRDLSRAEVYTSPFKRSKAPLVEAVFSWAIVLSYAPLCQH